MQRENEKSLRIITRGQSSSVLPVESQENVALPDITQSNGLRYGRAFWTAIRQYLNPQDSSYQDAAVQEQKRILTDNILLVALRPLFAGVAFVIFGATIFRMSTVSFFMMGLFTLVFGLIIGGGLLATQRLLIQERIPSRWAHPLAAMLSISTYLFILYNLVFRYDKFPELRFVGLSLLVIMTGALFLQLRWLLGMMLFIFASWTAVNLALSLTMTWSVYLILYPIIGVSALANFTARRRAISQMIDAQMENDLRSAQLEEALERAHRSEAQLTTELDLADQVVDSMGQGLALLDSNGRFEYANAAAERILGISMTTLLGQSADDILQGLGGGHDEQSLNNHNQSTELPEPFEVFIDHESGEVSSISVAITARAGGGTILTLTDLTLPRKIEAKLKRLAHFDALTGLPNRTRFIEWLEEIAAESQDNPVQVAVLFIDLNRFKQVNDTMGHAVGDRVLVESANRIKNSIRAHDTAARFGGDEFVVLLVDVADEHAAIDVAERIVRRIEEPFILPDRIHTLSSSVGISIGLGPQHRS